MDNKGTAYIVGGVVALVLINKIAGAFSSSPADITAEQQAQADQVLAGKFMQPSVFPELWTSNPFTALAAAGGVSQADLDSTAPHTARIAAAALQYHGAKGVVVDTESEAVAAVALPNYFCMLIMAETFANAYGETLGSYGATFLEPEHKAAICRIILELRP